MVGTGIESIRRRQERDQALNASRPKAAKGILAGGSGATDALNVTVAGTAYPVFVPGVDDPDDPVTARWVP